LCVQSDGGARGRERSVTGGPKSRFQFPQRNRPISNDTMNGESKTPLVRASIAQTLAGIRLHEATKLADRAKKHKKSQAQASARTRIRRKIVHRPPVIKEALEAGCLVPCPRDFDISKLVVASYAMIIEIACFSSRAGNADGKREIKLPRIICLTPIISRLIGLRHSWAIALYP